MSPISDNTICSSRGGYTSDAGCNCPLMLQKEGKKSLKICDNCIVQDINFQGSMTPKPLVNSKTHRWPHPSPNPIHPNWKKSLIWTKQDEWSFHTADQCDRHESVIRHSLLINTNQTDSVLREWYSPGDRNRGYCVISDFGSRKFDIFIIVEINDSVFCDQ